MSPKSKFPPGSRRALEEAQKPKKRGTAAGKGSGAVLCGAKKRQGGKCTLAAGWGTPHPGTGKCKLHGGSVPNHIKAAAKDEYRKLLGVPMEINPLDALIWCIKIRAGEIQWLSTKMAELDSKDWIEDTMIGKQFHLYARERQHAMNDLARYSQMAISLGIADRAVRLAETYGELLARYTRGLLDDLWPYLNEEGREKALHFARQRLIEMDGGPPADKTAMPKELVAA